MATPIIKPAFTSGELSPALWGRIELSKWHSGATVFRNMFVRYQGGAASRAGMAFVGQCKQSGTALPPRIITFRFNVFQQYVLEFGDQYMRVVADGAYVTEASFNITGATQADPCVLDIPGHNYSVGDWIFLSNFPSSSMFQLNGETVLVSNVSGNNVTLSDTFGNPIQSTFFNPYTSGGTSARIFTLATPYNAVDLPYLKYTQSADVMSLCLVNQETQTEYLFKDLTRNAANNWTLATPVIASSIGPPTSASATPSVAWTSGDPGPVAYGYVVTAIDAVTGDESIASNIAVASNSVDIDLTFGTVTVSWTAPATSDGVSGYNIYKTTPDATNTGNFVGQLFGFAGSTTGATTWHDNNIIADFTTPPPLHLDPFSGTGNNPGIVAYFQQRRGYGASLNNPDGYHFSQPGSYLNFDASVPPIDSDAITGDPWAQQVNGLQCMVPMPGGLIVGTGLDAWQLSGTGGAGTPISPAQQSAQPQESYGFSATLDPIRISWHILYIPQVGTSIQDMEYNFWNNMYAGTEISLLSSHLFLNYQIDSWALARQPYKVVWMVRNDGLGLSMTYMKEQEVVGIARHDTNGLFVSNAVATEPPVDAPYFVVKRYISGVGQWAYYLERMDNRQWTNDPESTYCVDAGSSLPLTFPSSTLTASRASPSLGCLAGPVIVGGSNYTAPQGVIADQGGQGTGAIVGSVSVVGGAIQSYTISSAGTDYIRPVISFTDSTGSGAQAQVLVDLSVVFTAANGTFSNSNVGNVIRMGGGKATVTAVNGAGNQANANFIAPITDTVPDDPNNLPVPATSGNWSIGAPVNAITGLDYLEGMTVTGLADGNVIPPTMVENGSIALSVPASAVTIGLGFTAQLQSMHTELGAGQGETVQGKAVKIVGVTARIEGSGLFQLGQDQPIASQQANQAEYPWTNMTTVQSRRPVSPFASNVAPPLFTGDRYIAISGDWNVANKTPNDTVPMPGEAPRAPGMVACQQTNPLPMNILALVPADVVGDTSDMADLRG